jgi:hypothetical protein
MIERAGRGDLNRYMTIVESTTGNAGRVRPSPRSRATTASS